MPNASIIQIVFGVVSLVLLWTTWFLKRNEAKQKRMDQIDKEIEDADSFDAFVRISDELHDK